MEYYLLILREACQVNLGILKCVTDDAFWKAKKLHGEH
jgi:hypothetical protein